MTCVISRNFAQPIPHHANPNSIVVAELQLNGLKAHTFAVGQKMFPESFSSWLLGVAQQLFFPSLSPENHHIWNPHIRHIHSYQDSQRSSVLGGVGH